MDESVSAADALQVLLRATVNFIMGQAVTAVDRFKPACRDSLDSAPYESIAPRQLLVSALLKPALELATDETRPLLALYEAHQEHLFFEQSYSPADTTISARMLAGYGFAEIAGERGPFVSHAVRIGIGIWAANIDYPMHRHAAEEAYIVLAGSAAFCVGNRGSDTTAIASPADNYIRHAAGDIVCVPSNTPHGFRTSDDPIVVLYIWQHGDLREKSTFEMTQS